MKPQTIPQISRCLFQKAGHWLTLVVLCTATLLPACSPTESGSTGSSPTSSVPQALAPSATAEYPVDHIENNPPSTPQPTSTKPCRLQESTQETATTVSVPRTPSSSEGSASNPNLIDLTEREISDESASAPGSECETVTPTPGPHAEGETPSQ